MEVRSDIDRHRVRRTLNEVKRKLEEALRLSKELHNKGNYAEPTSTNHRR
jgi:hypothetical protein